MLERSCILLGMNNLPAERQAAVIAALVEGNSIRATVRMTGVAKDTVIKLLAKIGQVCAEYQDKTLRNLPCKRVQCDEIWSFCYAKEKNVPADKRGQPGFGDVWTWTALCADTKLIACWRVGSRNAWHAQHFMYDLASRLSNRVQLTTRKTLRRRPKRKGNPIQPSSVHRRDSNYDHWRPKSASHLD